MKSDRLMKTAVALTLACAALGGGAGELRHRWAYLSQSLTSDADVALASNVVRTAAQGGMNGVMLSCGLDFLKFWPPDRFVRLEAIRKLCADRRMEIVPSGWSLGYGAIQNYGRNLIEAMPIEGIPYVVRGREIVYDAARAETVDLGGKVGMQRQKPYCRAIIRTAVRPNRRYRFSFEYATKGLKGSTPFRLFVRNVEQKQYHECEGLTLKPRPTQDWTAEKIDFNSGESKEYYLYVGLMSGWEAGDFEIRNARLAEIAPSAVVQRPGAPRALRSAATGRVYAQGRDYDVPLMHYPAWAQDRPPAVLTVPSGSSLRDGERLVFDCHAPAVVDGQQVSLCLSEPCLFGEVIPDSVRRVEELLHPKTWHISMDEFRNGNWCRACRARNLAMGEIYADAVTKLHAAIRRVSPAAEIHIWSDMLDPNHNAVESYYNSRGSFVGAWERIPKDLVIDCWYDRRSELSLEFFSSRGFRTLAAAYYDEKPPFAFSRRWRDGILRTPGGTGIMYTTWRRAYADLPAFCDLVNGKDAASAAPYAVEDDGETVRIRRAFDSAPVAEFRRSEAPADCRLTVRTEPDSPFVFVDVAPSVRPADRTVGRLDLPRITLAPFAAKPKAMSNAGLTEVDGHTGALGFLAVAEPKTRRGVVAAWLTNERASGVVKSGFAPDGRVTLRPFAEYGRMLVKSGVAVRPDTFVIGAFDDCRLGLEAYADAAAKRAGTHLPPQIAGYTTWYPDRFGYSDRSRYPRGCGAGDEASTKAFADEIGRLRLGDWGFSFFQIDDQWQRSRELKGPARDFSATNPDGPYPNGFRPVTDYLAARGIRTGLWWMPFGGMSCDPCWAGRSNLFVRAAADVPACSGNATTGLTPAQKAGLPYETVWGGTCLDMTVPAARRYVADLTHRITWDWGMGYIKYDGMWTGYAADLAGGKSWKNDHFDNAVFADPTVPNVAAYRLGMRTMREAAKPGTFILGCNIAQNARSIVASFGLVDAMRIGGDNGPIDMFPARYDVGPKAASNLYFLNGRLWYNDPDPVYVRNVVPLGRARTFASFTSLAGDLFNFSDWLPDLGPERVEILKRTMAPHGVKAARPVDYFETALPTTWVVDGGAAKVYGFYNWNTNRAARIAHGARYAGLDPAKTYVGFDFWRDAWLPPFRGTFAVDVPADDCRVIAVRETADRPFVLSTSRHVASPLFDIRGERWDAAALTLAGSSVRVPEEAYELRVWVPDGLKCRPVAGATVRQEGNGLRVRFPPAAGTRAWKLAFARSR